VVKERRRHDRTIVAAEVEIVREREIEVLFALDLSEGGLFLSARPDESPWLTPSVPDLLSISLAELDDDLVVRARGRVMWRQDDSRGEMPGIGVAFEELDEGNRAALERMLAGARASARRMRDPSSPPSRSAQSPLCQRD
jgi:hypothetical protein